MASRNPQTMAKRAREQAVRERRERKQAKKAARVAAREEAALGAAASGSSELEAPSPVAEVAPEAGIVVSEH